MEEVANSAFVDQFLFFMLVRRARQDVKLEHLLLHWSPLHCGFAVREAAGFPVSLSTLAYKLAQSFCVKPSTFLGADHPQCSHMRIEWRTNSSEQDKVSSLSCTFPAQSIFKSLP